MIVHFSSAIEFTELLDLLAVGRQYGLKIGATSGSFDVAIARHALSLQECKKKCDVLLVLLNGDLSIKKYKGKNKPINVEDERAFMLASFRSVDHIVIFDELTPLELLSKLRPDIYFNLSEWGVDCVEKQELDKYGGELCIFDVMLPEKWSKSSTAMIKKINAAELYPSCRATFIDRDGVINDNNSGYVHKWEDFKILPGVTEALLELQQAGYKLIVVTNQSGVGKGMYTEKDVQALHRKMCDYFSERNIIIDAVYYCPHLPGDGCDCRKPGVGMLLRAVDEMGVNLSKSWLVGDSSTDIEAGRMANTKTVMIGVESEYCAQVRPHYFSKHLLEAVKYIVLHRQ